MCIVAVIKEKVITLSNITQTTHYVEESVEARDLSLAR